ncbi:hypothetical protein GRI39_02025 [Altererythrobacter indicus]|uniref:Uncharacterized protein n=1 Tax=Altericroceibacterium indicum TaxID=374177 RepID=A0A845A516_9SPHN|nr:hypothetical protein [Altericroceibacterium indicum]MXP24824.1 hypothetical protein [Altericroceibacterium indicum]
MARSKTSHQARINSLERALERAKGFEPGTLLTAKELYEFIGTNHVTLRDWTNNIPDLAEAGCFGRGGHGIGYQYEPRSTILMVIRHLEAEQAKAAAENRRMKEMAGGSSLQSVPDDFDLKQVQELVRTSNAVQDMRERQGELTDARKASAAMREIFSAMQASAMQAAQQADPDGQWEPKVRSAFEDAISSVMLAQRRAAQDVLGNLRAVGLSDAGGVA